jgi:hypothetical protein
MSAAASGPQYGALPAQASATIHEKQLEGERTGLQLADISS